MCKKCLKAAFSILFAFLIVGCTKEEQISKKPFEIPKMEQKALRIACVGDSITYGSTIDQRMQNSYPAQLQQKLNNKDEVINFGVDGATAQKQGNKPYWIQPEFNESKKYQPDIVFLMLGTNDSKTNNWISKEAFKKDYLALLKAYKELDSEPIVILMTPSTPYPEVVGELMNHMSQQEITTIAQIVREIAKEQNLVLIDIHEITKNHKENYLVDGVHPDKEGAARIMKAVYEKVTLYHLVEQINQYREYLYEYINK